MGVSLVIIVTNLMVQASSSCRMLDVTFLCVEKC